MAIFRKVPVEYWEDAFIYGLTFEQKSFFLYLLTNSKTKQCGIYEITLGKICAETGCDLQEVEELLKFFCEKDRIKYSKGSGEIAIKNWMKHNKSSAPTVIACVQRESANVKDEALLNYVGLSRD